MNQEQQKKSLKIVVMIDRIELVNYQQDTTLARMGSAHVGGHSLGDWQPHDLSLDSG